MTERLDEAALLRRLRASVREAGSAKAWAASAGLSAQYVSTVLRGRTAPGDSILRGLGLQREVTYVPREPEEVALYFADGETAVVGHRVFD